MYRLTRRQLDAVNELALDGACDAVIADRLGVTVFTAKCHIRDALKKTGCHSRGELIAALLRRRIRVVAGPR